MSNEDRKAPGANSIFLLALFGFLSPILTFAIAMTSLSAQTKISALAFVATAYAALFFFVYRRNVSEDDLDESTSETVTASYQNDAHASVDSSEGSEETFRAMLGKLRETFPIANATLFEVLSGGELNLIVEDRASETEASRSDLALLKMAAISGEMETEGQSIALPLSNEDRIFAVVGFQFSSDLEAESIVNEFTELADEMSLKFAAAFAFDQRVSTALTDPVTSLPNERAFLMVLEHQLAESLRHRDERPLSVIAIDLSGFAKLNEKFGHAIGDRALRFAAETLRLHFRTMDFLARIRDDEFLAVVPSADERTADEIVFRISTAFLERQFAFDDDHSVTLTPNFGTATFWRDGETPQQLIRQSQQMKQRAKAEEVVASNWPEKEYVH